MKQAITRHWTIRVRLTVLYGSLFLLAGILLLGVTYVLVEQRLDQQANAYGQKRRAALMRNQATGGEGYPIQLPNGQITTSQKLIENFQAEQDKIRADMMDSLLTQGGLALAGVGVISTALGWILAGRTLRPVHRITETARRIAGADGAGRGLHERIGLSGPPDEIKQLADTFDVMLERLDGSFDGQRRFVASASHEMRTPLAIKRALIEVSITRPAASPDAKELGEALLKVNARHERLIDGLLTLADSENEVTEKHPVDLADLTGNVLFDETGRAHTQGVRVLPSTLDGAPTAGDPYLLERIVQNLVENAIRHNVPRDGWVSARTWSTRDRAKVEVANTGPVIHDYETEALFQPFRRLNRRQPDTGSGGERGFGLGLSIVRAVARAHGGTAQATPREGGGLIVTVSLPLRREDAAAEDGHRPVHAPGASRSVTGA
jgi:signal transduction histidine kinase